MIEIETPWPPSVNHYYRRIPTKGTRGQGVRVLISKRGRQFREDVAEIVRRKGFDTFLKPAVLKLELIAHPPDRQERDLDNLLKALFDSLQHGGVFESDSQVKALKAIMGTPCDGGFCTVRITEITHVR